jgi:hypothetical protein
MQKKMGKNGSVSTAAAAQAEHAQEFTRPPHSCPRHSCPSSCPDDGQECAEGTRAAPKEAPGEAETLVLSHLLNGGRGKTFSTIVGALGLTAPVVNQALDTLVVEQRVVGIGSSMLDKCWYPIQHETEGVR